ncbi:MAG: DUF4147 domain-containing protein [Lachnospiraceae bacterium]|nr:DUF4147 domain-containing protein [Lachnospiraceae bacterium]
MVNDAKLIIDNALKSAMPGNAVKKALSGMDLQCNELVLIAAGKAAWEMANAAYAELGTAVKRGVVVTKYDHSKGAIGNLDIYEAGHPVPDENSYKGTAAALEAVKGADKVLFLLSGGGSALFEKPLVPATEMEAVTKALLACGADIVEINTIRKRLSAVKGGRFANYCAPAHVYTVVLSDIIGDPLDMIASGPAYPDTSTCEEALEIIGRYGIEVSAEAGKLLETETPKELTNVTTFVTGSVRQLCKSASETAKELGYEPVFLTACMSCEAREAGRFLGAVAKDHAHDGKKLAYICGGETVVHLTGTGKGGRNQEIALAAAEEIRGLKNVCVFSVGSDGTDGPTDAAGGIVTGATADALKMDIKKVLQDNDAYNALKSVDALIMTGPTGTNVNDLTVLLING